jgi:hypothetical protein
LNGWSAGFVGSVSSTITVLIGQALAASPVSLPL